MDESKLELRAGASKESGGWMSEYGASERVSAGRVNEWTNGQVCGE